MPNSRKGRPPTRTLSSKKRMRLVRAGKQHRAHEGASWSPAGRSPAPQAPSSPASPLCDDACGASRTKLTKSEVQELLRGGVMDGVRCVDDKPCERAALARGGRVTGLALLSAVLAGSISLCRFQQLVCLCRARVHVVVWGTVGHGGVR